MNINEELMNIHFSQEKVIIMAEEMCVKYNMVYHVITLNNGYEIVLDSYFNTRPDERNTIIHTTNIKL